MYPIAEQFTINSLLHQWVNTSYLIKNRLLFAIESKATRFKFCITKKSCYAVSTRFLNEKILFTTGFRALFRSCQVLQRCLRLIRETIILVTCTYKAICKLLENGDSRLEQTYRRETEMPLDEIFVFIRRWNHLRIMFFSIDSLYLSWITLDFLPGRY